MRRLLVIPLAAALFAGLLSACDAQFTPYAARVDGVSISQSSLDGALNSLKSDPGFACFEEELHGATHVTGATEDSYNASFAASVLSILIDSALAQRQHLRVTGFDLAVTRQQIISGFTSPQGSSCTARAADVYAQLPSDFRNRLVAYRAALNVLAARSLGVPLSAAGVAGYEASHRAESSLSCTRVIEVASLSKAQQLSVAIHAGASFATVARHDSLDASAAAGGLIGCIPATVLVSPLGSDVASLAVGALSSPIHFRNVYLLFLVERRELLSPTAAASQVVLPAGSAAATVAFDGLLKSAHVSVDPTFGSWQETKTAAQVVPPQGPPLDLVPNPAAVHATSAFS